MDTCRPCGCKGCRTCLICESEYKIDTKQNILTDDREAKSFVYCPLCNKSWSGWDVVNLNHHPNHHGNSSEFPGVYIQLDFLTTKEEEDLLWGIDNMSWDLSQSGRRKQNFGPKCNFKKKKLKLGNFNGFPKFTKFVQDKFLAVPVLKNFFTIEQCSLEYDPERGASIDPHIDDCWVWGERIVTVNLLSDSVLTMTLNNKSDRYNLDCVRTYPAVLDSSGLFSDNSNPYQLKSDHLLPIVRIPMPRRSLLVMYNSARYEWEHQILREDILSRRICLAYREFTPTYLKNGENYSEGKIILEKALNFW